MSSYGVLREVSNVLRGTLLDACQADEHAEPAIRGLKKSGVVFTNPTESFKNADARVSLWLYKVDEDQYTRNQARRPVASGDGIQGVPMTLDLSFLVTPLLRAENAEESLNLIGKIMQVFHEHASIPVSDRQAGIHENIRISFRRSTLEELTRVWEALREPYRLSVSYLVRVIHIAGRSERGAGAVRTRTAGGPA